MKSWEEMTESEKEAATDDKLQRSAIHLLCERANVPKSEWWKAYGDALDIMGGRFRVVISQKENRITPDELIYFFGEIHGCDTLVVFEEEVLGQKLQEEQEVFAQAV